MANLKKNPKQNIPDFDSEIEAGNEFHTFIVIESLEETSLTNLPPFLIKKRKKKVITCRANP